MQILRKDSCCPVCHAPLLVACNISTKDGLGTVYEYFHKDGSKHHSVVVDNSDVLGYHRDTFSPLFTSVVTRNERGRAIEGIAVIDVDNIN